MSVSNLAKRRGQILDEIMRYHREQLPKIMRDVPLENLRALSLIAPPPVDFLAALRRPGTGLIAECKKASPSRGLLVNQYDAAALARAYARAGATAVSVLTDGRHFQGSLDDLQRVKEALADRKGLTPNHERRLPMAVPVLRKDFIFHPYQVHESRAAGADALLLIAAVLSDNDLQELLALTHQLGMQAVVEVHSEAELARVLPLSPPIIGINNRNLQTFAVDFDNSARLRQLIPAGIVTVAESGIKTAEDVLQMRKLGMDAVLVGETLVRSKNVLEAARALVKAGQEKNTE